MDSYAVGGNVVEEMCKQNSEGEEKGSLGKNRPATDLGQCPGNPARSNPPEWAYTMFMFVICWVSNWNDIILSPNQLQALYTDVRHWEELINFINKNRGLKAPYILMSMFKCNLEQD